MINHRYRAPAPPLFIVILRHHRADALSFLAEGVHAPSGVMTSLGRFIGSKDNASSQEIQVSRWAATR